MSHPLLEIIAFGMALGNRSVRQRIQPSMIRDDELRLLFLAMQKSDVKTIRTWFRRIGVNDDKDLVSALLERLIVDAESERTVDCMQEMLAELRERKQRREIDENCRASA